MSLQLVIKTDQGLALFASKLAGTDIATLKAGLAELLVSQTKERIVSEKQSPDGTAWEKPKAGGEALHKAGMLRDSIAASVNGDEIEVGSNLVYAAIHQLGGTIKPKKAKTLAFTIGGKTIFAKSVVIPARPYLGFSTQNMQEIEQTAQDFMLGVH